MSKQLENVFKKALSVSLKEGRLLCLTNFDFQ